MEESKEIKEIVYKDHQLEWVNVEEQKLDKQLEYNEESRKQFYEKTTLMEIVETAKIKEFITAQKNLEDRGFLKVVGHDPNQIMTYLIFGHNYPQKNEDEEFKMYIRDMVTYIDFRKRLFQIIYFHDTSQYWKSPPLKALKNSLVNHEKYLVSFQGIHLTSFWVKLEISDNILRCTKQSLQNVQFHDTIVSYLRTIESNPQFCVKIVSSLPKLTTDKYFQERNDLNYEIPLDSAQLARMSQNQRVSQMLLTQSQRETVVPSASTLAQATTQANKFELLGRPLSSLPTVIIKHQSGYQEEIPLTVFLLTQYFHNNPQHFERQGIFRVNGDKSQIEELSIHLQLGDFSILRKFTERPNEIANFLKEILRELTEPVCPFEKYPDFRDLSKGLTPQQKLRSIVTLLRDLPELNRCTLMYLARFFNYVSTFSAKNLMNPYNLAVIVTPNLFRSRELTSKDLLNHGTLTDVFTMLMANVDSIIKDIQADEKNEDLLVNQIISSKKIPDGQSQSSREINRSSGMPKVGFLPAEKEEQLTFDKLLGGGF